MNIAPDFDKNRCNKQTRDTARFSRSSDPAACVAFFIHISSCGMTEPASHDAWCSVAETPAPPPRHLRRTCRSISAKPRVEPKSPSLDLRLLYGGERALMRTEGGITRRVRKTRFRQDHSRVVGWSLTPANLFNGNAHCGDVTDDRPIILPIHIALAL
jgi:hypothetical protein